VGDGPDREELERDVHAAGIPVSFSGYLKGSALAEALSGARGVIMPSECYENAPLTLLESFAAGKPVIGSRIGGIPEMIEHGVNGFLFEPSNVEALAETIDRFISFPDMEVVSMAREARARVGQKFSPKRHYASLMEVYSQALKKPCV
jgi:glycosyltransferase involved in cell wall biosynthesis